MTAPPAAPAAAQPGRPRPFERYLDLLGPPNLSYVDTISEIGNDGDAFEVKLWYGTEPTQVPPS